MATNSFICNENKGLLWEMMLSNNMFDGVSNENFSNVKTMFENVILRLGQNIKNDLSKDELLSLNKTAILEIRTNLDIFKKKNNEDTFNNEKVLVFDRNLENAKNNFSETIAIKKPEQPEFSSKADTPIATNNMNELLKKLQREREQLLPPPPPNPHTTEAEPNQQDNPIKKPLIIENAQSQNAQSENAQSENAQSENAQSENAQSENAQSENAQSENSLKKLTNIEELFGINMSETCRPEQSQQTINKRVSFSNNTIPENAIPENHIYNKILGENTPNLINQEYLGEKKINDNLKLNSIFNLLKEIDKKQDQIIEILKSS